MATDISLWSLKTGFIGLNQGQSDYKLSDYLDGNNTVKNIGQAFIRTSQSNFSTFPSFQISQIIVLDIVATATTQNNHTFKVGDEVRISNSTVPGLNTPVSTTITAITDNTFNYSVNYGTPSELNSKASVSLSNIISVSVIGGESVAGHNVDQLFSSTPGSYCQYIYDPDPFVFELQLKFSYIFANPTIIKMFGIQGYYVPGQVAKDQNILSVNITADNLTQNLVSIVDKPFTTNATPLKITPLTYWFENESQKPYSVYKFTITATPQNLIFQTLALSNIYLCTNIQDTQLSAIPRSTYLSVVNKSQQSRPSSYYLNRQSDPILSLWPTPSSQYNCLMISYEQMVNDVNTAVDTLSSPALYNEAVVWGLAYRLACKYAPDKITFCKQMADETLKTVSNNYSETTPLVMAPDWTRR